MLASNGLRPTGRSQDRSIPLPLRRARHTLRHASLVLRFSGARIRSGAESGRGTGETVTAAPEYESELERGV